MFLSAGRTIHVNRNGYLTIGILVVVTVLIFYGFNYSDGLSGNFKSPGNFKEFINLKDLLSAAIDAAKRGGYKVISEEKSTNVNGAEVTPANTENKELDSLLINGEYINGKDIQIWIDPLDATQEYTEDLRQYVTTMVCVAVKGVPTIGVIHNPFSDLTAWAWVDKAHNPRLKVDKEKDSKPNEPVRVIISRSHSGPVVAKAKEAFGEDVRVTTAGGAGYKILEVLSGRQDVYLHTTLIKKWDICAGNAILNHFRGKMTTVNGSEIDYSSSSDYKNPEGLVASLNNHLFYISKLNFR